MSWTDMKQVYADLERRIAPLPGEHVEHGTVFEGAKPAPAVRTYDGDSPFQTTNRMVYRWLDRIFDAGFYEQQTFIPVPMEHELSHPTIRDPQYASLEEFVANWQDPRPQDPPRQRRTERGQVHIPYSVPAIRVIFGDGDPTDQITNPNPPTVKIAYWLGGPLTAGYHERRTFSPYPLD